MSSAFPATIGLTRGCKPSRRRLLGDIVYIPARAGLNAYGSFIADQTFVYAPVFVVDQDEPTPPRSIPGTKDTSKTEEQARCTQRSRLLDAIVETVARAGYPETKIGDIASRAGVSRATFYELFENKQACFVAAHRERASRLSAEAASAIAEGDPTRATDVVFSTLVDVAARDPLAFSFLTHEAILAGPDALDERDRLIARLEELIEHAHGQAPSTATLPDVPARILLGGLIRVIGMRIRGGQYDSRQLLAEMIGWVDSYRVPEGAKRRWSLVPNTELANVGQGIAPPVSAPVPLPRGRHRLPTELVKRVQRERILHATAEVIRAKGYANTTVADIVAAAGVSREVFYSDFRSRPDAFVETHKLIFEQVMAATAGAFFASSGAWPEQAWDGWSVLTSFAVSAPGFAHFGLVESYALGPVIAQRTDDAILAFTVFLREGRGYRPEAAQPSQSALDAVAGAAMETAAFYVRHRRAEELFGLLPLTIYVTLAPLMGAAAAREFVERKLREMH